MGDPAVTSSPPATSSKPESGGLKQQWNLKDAPPLDESATSEQAKKFLGSFKATMASVNTCLQYTVVNAEKAKHDPYVVERDNLYTSFQAAQKKIDPADESKAKTDIDSVLNTANGCSAKTDQFKQATEKLVNDWKAKEGEFDKSGTQIEELEKWEDKAAPEFRKSVDGIRTAANDRKYDESLKSLNELLPKLSPVYEEYQKQKAAKETYEPKWSPVQSRLDAVLAAQPKKEDLKAPFEETKTIKSDIEKAVAKKDYVSANPLVDRLPPLIEKLEKGAKQISDQERKEIFAQLDAMEKKLEKMLADHQITV